MADCCDSAASFGGFGQMFHCLFPINPYMKKHQERLETFQSPNLPRERILATPHEIEAVEAKVVI